MSWHIPVLSWPLFHAFSGELYTSWRVLWLVTQWILGNSTPFKGDNSNQIQNNYKNNVQHKHQANTQWKRKMWHKLLWFFALLCLSGAKLKPTASAFRFVFDSLLKTNKKELLPKMVQSVVSFCALRFWCYVLLWCYIQKWFIVLC